MYEIDRIINQGVRYDELNINSKINDKIKNHRQKLKKVTNGRLTNSLLHMKQSEKEMSDDQGKDGDMFEDEPGKSRWMMMMKE